MKKRRIALALAGLVAFAAAFNSPAAPPGPLGTGETSVALFSIDGSIGGVSQSVDLTIGSGLATTDPTRSPYPLASLLIAMARAEGLVDVNSAPFDVQTRAEGPGSDSESDTELAQSFGFGGALAGSVTIGSRTAEVTDAAAVANLGQVLMNATVLNGLVALDGITITGVSDESDATKATASQGVHIDSVRFFSLAQLLEQLGTSLRNLSIDSLLGLADSILGPGATQPLRDALQQVTDAEAAVAAANLALSAAGQAVTNTAVAVANAQEDVDAALGANAETEADAAALSGAVAELTDGGIPGPEDVAAADTILALAVKYGVSTVGDPLTIAAAVAVAIDAAHAEAQAALAAAQTALSAARAALAAAKAALAAAQAALAVAQARLDAALAALDLVRAALEGTIGDLSLVSLRDVSVSVTAKAFDTYSEATSGVSWGSAEVVGQAVPTVDLGAAAQLLESAVNDVMAAVGRAIGLDVTAALTFPVSRHSTGTEGAYQVAASEVTGFGISVSVGQSVLGLRPALVGNSVAVSASVLSLTARASHLPAEAPQGSPDNPQGSPDNSDVAGGTQGSPDGTPQGSPESGPQAPAGSPGGSPEVPQDSPALPKTGIDARLLLLLACQLILLGWALERRQGLIEKQTQA